MRYILCIGRQSGHRYISKPPIKGIKMTHRKIGGIHFIRMGRFGASFYITKAKPSDSTPVLDVLTAVAMGLMFATFLFLGV